MTINLDDQFEQTVGQEYYAKIPAKLGPLFERVIAIQIMTGFSHFTVQMLMDNHRFTQDQANEYIVYGVGEGFIREYVPRASFRP